MKYEETLKVATNPVINSIPGSFIFSAAVVLKSTKLIAQS